MSVLLSIKPKYVKEMIEGNKRYEFRKTLFKQEVDVVWIYATSPIKKIIGTFVVGEIIKDTPEKLWEKFNGLSGMTEKEFYSYFHGKEVGFALEIWDLRLLKCPIEPKAVFPEFVPPQSFCYFDASQIESLFDDQALCCLDAYENDPNSLCFEHLNGKARDKVYHNYQSIAPPDRSRL